MSSTLSGNSLATEDITVSGDITLADNSKAIFGAGSDLQIYHDGSNSVIADFGSGVLDIKSDGAAIQLSSNTGELYAYFSNNGDSQLYYDNSKKLATTTTGIDVTGTATMDGLTVDGNPTITSTAGGRSLVIESGDQTATLELSSDTSNTQTNRDTFVQYSTNGAGVWAHGMDESASKAFILSPDGTTYGSARYLKVTTGGDISFYEDTGSTPKFFWDASAESLGIGKTSGFSPNSFYLGDGTQPTFYQYFNTANTGNAGVIFGDTNDVDAGYITYDHSANRMAFGVNASERMRIDSSGNLLVGKTSADNTTVGTTIYSGGASSFVRSSNAVSIFNRLTNDGDIVQFRKDGTTVGSIGVVASDMYIGTGDTFVRFHDGVDGLIPCTSTGSDRDNVMDLGAGTVRFDDVYATNGTIQTSDRNEKQDIAELDEAEQRVAQACKGLLRKFRWKDSVAEKGDDARIHFGIIAQDLQAAFEAEGLDAGKYAMFISTTWWETTEEVPAVEAVEATYDEEGNVLTEAVEAKEAYARTDTYETAEEAPEGAIERTRLGVRYPELLAFIIAAI